MSDQEEEKEKKPFWQRGGEGKSEALFMTLITVTIAMLIIVTSVGAYGYISWQDWKKGPQIGVEEGLFEHKGLGENGSADFTVHLTVKNNGEDKSGKLRLEWFVMKESKAQNNIYMKRGEKILSSLDEKKEKEYTFDLTLPQGDYVLSYRVYEDGLFSYEARQSLTVREDEVAKEGARTETVPEFPSLAIPVIVVIAILVVFSRMNKREEKRAENSGKGDEA